jgi:hypothetical protein
LWHDVPVIKGVNVITTDSENALITSFERIDFSRIEFTDAKACVSNINFMSYRRYPACMYRFVLAAK